MRRLTLVRHANAQPKDVRLSDFDRPLDRTGLAEAESIARRLAGRGPAPDLLVTSPARRTRQTADALALAMGIPAYRMQDERRLYLAPAETILEHIRLTEPSVQHLMIVGHNPGLSDLASWLAGPGRITTGLSTGSAYILTFESESWSDVAPSVLVEVLCESPQP